MPKRKILIRAHVSPFANPSFREILAGNLIGNNIGNFIFAHSVARACMTEGTQVDTIKTNRLPSGAEIERINSEYDCFLIPLANAFRSSFVRELRTLTKLVQRLTIPCVVVGVGYQPPNSQRWDALSEEGFAFDDNVRKFMRAVLEKSNIVGLRGEKTAEYLEQLGFTRERDFTVIGCPSMYMYGASTPRFEKPELTPQSAINVNCKVKIESNIHDFMARSVALLENYRYTPQVLDELFILYTGKTMPGADYEGSPAYYPTYGDHPMYKNGHGIGFLNDSAWLSYLAQRDFSFGTRIHGNISAIVSGTPAYVIVSDHRILELVEYHKIPHSLAVNIPEGQTIFDLYEDADYDAMFSVQKKNFDHYRDFLDANGVPHIYQGVDAVENAPFDKAYAAVDFNPPFEAYCCVSLFERIRRDSVYKAHIKTKKAKAKKKGA